MQKRVATFIFISFLLCTALASFADEKRNNPEQQLASFEFVVELGDSKTSFESHHGTNWLTLSWGTPFGESSFWLDESGVSPSEPDLSGHTFLIHVNATPEKIEFESKRGTSWTKLSYNSIEFRRAVVDEYGIQKEVVER